MKKWLIREDKNIADIMIEVYGKDELDLLKNILQAFTSLTTNIEKIKEIKKLRNLEIKGENFVEVVFNFVEKLIYYKDADGLIFKKGKFDFENKEKSKVKMTLFGQKITADLPVKIDIKALTRHKFMVEKNKNYRTVMVFDV